MGLNQKTKYLNIQRESAKANLSGNSADVTSESMTVQHLPHTQ